MTPRLAFPVAGAVLVAVSLGSIAVGAMVIDGPTLLSIAAGWWGATIDPGHTQAQAAVLTQIRLPRVVFGLVAGGVLGLCGSVLQGLFRNPLADPGLLGISSGAALAVGLVVVGFPGLRAAWGPWALPASAFTGSLVAAGVVWALSTRIKGDSSALLLAGVAVTALAGAGTGLVITVARDAELRDLTFWTLGSLGGVTWMTLGAALPFLVVPFVLIPWMARHLDTLLLGDREALSLGTPLRRLRVVSLLATAGGVGAVTALAGSVSFVGLIVPHLARLLVGPRHRPQMTMAVVIGALLTVGADTLSRTLVAPAELPLGVVLGFIGAPFLVRLLGSRRA